MKRILLILIFLAAAVHFGVPAAHAEPPPPPTPPGCHGCTGPPSPPTPVPTLGQGTVPVVQSVSVELAPTHIKRGGTTKASVTAGADARVAFVVHYHSGKLTTYHAKVGESGKLTRHWRVPKTAPLGKGTVKITVQGAGDPYVTTIKLVVIR